MKSGQGFCWSPVPLSYGTLFGIIINAGMLFSNHTDAVFPVKGEKNEFFDSFREKSSFVVNVVFLSND